MPNETRKPIQIEYTPELKRNLRGLAKKYRHVRSDVQPFIDRLAAGESPGDQVPGIGLTVYKVRIPNRDIRKGKRSGYRLLYYIKTPTKVILITLYSKLEQADVSAVRIHRILAEFEAQ